MAPSAPPHCVSCTLQTWQWYFSGNLWIPWIVGVSPQPLLPSSHGRCPLSFFVSKFPHFIWIKSYWIKTHPNEIMSTWSSAKILFLRKATFTDTWGFNTFGENKIQTLTLNKYLTLWISKFIMIVSKLFSQTSQDLGGWATLYFLNAVHVPRTQSSKETGTMEKKPVWGNLTNVGHPYFLIR